MNLVSLSSSNVASVDFDIIGLLTTIDIAVPLVISIAEKIIGFFKKHKFNEAETVDIPSGVYSDKYGNGEETYFGYFEFYHKPNIVRAGFYSEEIKQWAVMVDNIYSDEAQSLESRYEARKAIYEIVTVQGINKLPIA